MNICLAVEIHIHGAIADETPLSICLKSNVAGEEQKFGEIALVAFYAIRTMSNFGVCEAADKIASLLIQAPQFIPKWAKGELPCGVTLISHPGRDGQKRMYLDMRLSPGSVDDSFDVKYSGFDLVSTGMNIYALASLMALLRYLTLMRADDSTFLTRLAQASLMSGQCYAQRLITLFNHGELVSRIIATLADLDRSTNK